MRSCHLAKTTRPEDMLQEGLNALNGVCDLLISNLRDQQSQMELVDPENLAAVLDLISLRLTQAAEIFDKR